MAMNDLVNAAIWTKITVAMLSSQESYPVHWVSDVFKQQKAKLFMLKLHDGFKR